MTERGGHAVAVRLTVPAPSLLEPAMSSSSPRPSLRDLESASPFTGRHIGPSEQEQAKMLAVLGRGSLEELADAAVPEAIRATSRLDLPGGLSEPEVLAELRVLADSNRVTVPMIGLGYAGTHTPGV